MDYNKMPTNSFENFLLSWVPDRSKLKRPYYLTLANALEADIISGKLAAGTRLPPQRELADFLDLNFTTVTSAYNLCRERNLIYGITGRGTFVSPLPGKMHSFSAVSGIAVTELGVVKGFDRVNTHVLEASENVLKKGYINELYSYTEPAGHLHQRAAGAHFMRRMDVFTDSEHTAIFSGAQNVISAALLSLFCIGDALAVDEYTYSNLIGTARLSHIRLIPVCGDCLGMHPDELDKVCRKESVKGVFLMPNCANPTTVTLSEKRKDELAAIIERHNLILIEDDNTGILPAAAPDYHSMFSRLPKQTVYICNSTMTLCNGLRVAFAAFPESFRLQLLNALYLLNIKTSSFDAEIVTELILSGKASKILEQKAALAKRRNQIADSILPQIEKAGSTAAFFRWFKLPQGVPDGVELEKLLLEHKVNVYAAYRFTVLRKPGNYLRLAISSPVSDEELSAGLSRVSDFVKQYTAEN